MRAPYRASVEAVEAVTDPSDVLVPAAVSPLVAGAVAGAVRPCRVLAAFPTCLYLGLGAHADVLAVLASDALALPIGLRLAEPSTAVRWGVDAGDTVLVGAGRVSLPHAEVVASRLARPARVRPGVRRVGAAGLLPEPGVLGQLVRELVADALAGRPVEPAVRGLVGAGRGLTPSGDDALCGALLAIVASGGSGAAQVTGLQRHPDAGRALSMVRTAVRSALGRTTSLSAALLVAAGDGYATPEVARLVASLQVGPTVAARSQAPSAAVVAAVSDLLGPVLSIGHSSGHDLVSGLAGALLALEEGDAVDSQKLSEHRHRTDPTEKGSRSA